MNKIFLIFVKSRRVKLGRYKSKLEECQNGKKESQTTINLKKNVDCLLDIVVLQYN